MSESNDKNEEYWQNRAVWNMYDEMEKAEDTADEIAILYRDASGWLSEQAKAVFEKYRKKHHLSDAEARRLLNIMHDKTSIDEMLTALKNGDFTNKAELIAELEGPAYRARIERFEQLQVQLDMVMQKVYAQEKTISTKFYTDLAKESYYKSMFEIQKRAGVAFSFNHVSSKQIDKVLSMNWSGKHYSERIWTNTQNLAETLKQELLVNLVTGRTERECAEVIAKKFGQGAMQARRLVRTESSFVSGQLNLEADKEAEIEEYMFLAKLDFRTSKICRELDCKIFKVSEAKVGVNYNPMHPQCRSATISIIDREYISKMTKKVLNPSTGKTVTIPLSMNYQQWYDKYVEKRY